MFSAININISSPHFLNMAKKKRKRKLSPSLLIIGIVSGMFATFGMMCIPCIMAAYPSIGLFFASLGALSILLVRYNWVFLIIGVLLISTGVLLQFWGSKKKCE
jgi:uncharacterized protein YqhQ